MFYVLTFILLSLKGTFSMEEQKINLNCGVKRRAEIAYNQTQENQNQLLPVKKKIKRECDLFQEKESLEEDTSLPMNVDIPALPPEVINNILGYLVFIKGTPQSIANECNASQSCKAYCHLIDQHIKVMFYPNDTHPILSSPFLQPFAPWRLSHRFRVKMFDFILFDLNIVGTDFKQGIYESHRCRQLSEQCAKLKFPAVNLLQSYAMQYHEQDYYHKSKRFVKEILNALTVNDPKNVEFIVFLQLWEFPLVEAHRRPVPEKVKRLNNTFCFDKYKVLEYLEYLLEAGFGDAVKIMLRTTREMSGTNGFINFMKVKKAYHLKFSKDIKGEENEAERVKKKKIMLWFDEFPDQGENEKEGSADDDGHTF